MVSDKEASELFFRQGRKPPQGFVPFKVLQQSQGAKRPTKRHAVLIIAYLEYVDGKTPEIRNIEVYHTC